MPTTRFSSTDGDLDVLYQHLAEQDLQPLWELHGLLTKEPKARAVPHVWHFADLVALAARAGALVGITRGGDRRVLACANPGLRGAPYAVGTLWAAVQYLQGGETAPSHRHTPAALRFVLEGDGVWTLVDGDALPMAAGDLVITPSWTFHEHHNGGSAPMMWLDVLDLPLVEAVDAVFYEDGPPGGGRAQGPPTSRSERAYASPGLQPVGAPVAATAASPLLRYRWADTDRALDLQLEDGRPAGRIRFTDPTSGRDVMPTMRCEMLRVPSGAATPAHRQTGSRVCSVLHGGGSVMLDGVAHDVSAGDIVAVPSWCSLSITAGAELDVFTVSDAPVLHALGLFREETSP